MTDIGDVNGNRECTSESIKGIYTTTSIYRKSHEGYAKCSLERSNPMHVMISV